MIWERHFADTCKYYLFVCRTKYMQRTTTHTDAFMITPPSLPPPCVGISQVIFCHRRQNMRQRVIQKGQRLVMPSTDQYDKKEGKWMQGT